MNSTSSTPHPTPALIRLTNHGINFVADISYTCYKKAGSIVVSAALGTIGGRLVGISAPMGALQGFVSAALYAWTFKPINKYVERNAGEGDDQINKTGQRFIYTATAIAEIFLSIFIVNKYGHTILDKTRSHLPAFLSNRLIVSPNTSYSIGKGLLCFVAPAIAMMTIDYLENESEDQRRKA